MQRQQKSKKTYQNFAHNVDFQKVVLWLHPSSGDKYTTIIIISSGLFGLHIYSEPNVLEDNIHFSCP